MSGARLKRMIETYMEGRESSTMKSYQSSFAKLGMICRKLELSLYSLDELARCEVWAECRMQEMSAGSIKGLSAVISLVREVLGQSEVISGREKVMKRSVIKSSNLKSVKKSRRKEATIGDVLGMVREARNTGSKSDYRLAMMGVLCFFGVRRFADVREVRVKDVLRVEDHLEVFIKGHKTDVEGTGDSFTLVRKGRRFHIHNFLKEYVAKMGIDGGDALFPVELGRGKKRKAASYSVMYSSLEEMKTRLGMSGNITWHSFRVGAATRGTSLGVRRNIVKKAGLWRSSAVDTYCRETNPGVMLSLALINDME